MFDDFLPIPDAESLPFYPLVLQLVVCVYHEIGKVNTGIVLNRMPARESCLTPRVTDPGQPRAVPIGGGDVDALSARPGMPQTHIYARHT